jgi:hypothetical protein
MAVTSAGSYGLVWLIRLKKRWIVRKVPYFGTQGGGYVLAFGTGVAWGLAGALGAGMGWRGSIEQALISMFTSIGAWQMTKDVKELSAPAVVPASAEPPAEPPGSPGGI